MEHRGVYCCEYRGTSCLDFGLQVKKRPSIPAPSRRVTTIQVAGRSGKMVIDDELFDDIVIPVQFNFLSKNPDTWMEAFRKAKQWLRNDGNLSFSDDEDWFFYVKYIQIADTERTTRRLGNFTAEFTCDPYMFARSGEIERTPEECRHNPYMISHPLYRIIGTGSGTLYINNNSIAFTSPGELKIDTEMMITSDGSGTLRNAAINGDYSDAYLLEGENDIDISAGFTIAVTPRWRTI